MRSVGLGARVVERALDEVNADHVPSCWQDGSTSRRWHRPTVARDSSVSYALVGDAEESISKRFVVDAEPARVVIDNVGVVRRVELGVSG
jgi:hypothetical protein